MLRGLGQVVGIDSEILSPADVKQLVPFINDKVFKTSFYTSGIGTVDSLHGGTLMREQAQALGALTVFPKIEIAREEINRVLAPSVQAEWI